MFFTYIFFECHYTSSHQCSACFRLGLDRKICKILSTFNTKLPNMEKTIIFLSLCVSNLLMLCGDIEVNPGPKYSFLTFCHWNLNGLTAHDNIKISLLQAYVTQYNCGIICLSETFLNPSIQNDEDRIKIDGYNLIRSDHPSDSKKEEFVFIKKSLYLLLNEMYLYSTQLFSYRNSLSKSKMFFNLSVPFTKTKSR